MSIIVAALLVWKFGIGAFLSSVLAVTLHECFHAIAAKTRGYPSERIIFLPYGATLYNNHDFDKTSNVIIALAGPLLNLSLALFTVTISSNVFLRKSLDGAFQSFAGNSAGRRKSYRGDFGI